MYTTFYTLEQIVFFFLSELQYVTKIGLPIIRGKLYTKMFKTGEDNDR